MTTGKSKIILALLALFCLPKATFGGDVFYDKQFFNERNFYYENALGF